MNWCTGSPLRSKLHHFNVPLLWKGLCLYLMSHSQKSAVISTVFGIFCVYIISVYSSINSTYRNNHLWVSFSAHRPATVTASFMPDVTFRGFLLDFCLYCYRTKPYFHHFSPPIAVVWPSSTPSVLSGINRIFTVAKQMRKSVMILGCEIYIRSIFSLSYGRVLYFP